MIAHFVHQTLESKFLTKCSYAPPAIGGLRNTQNFFDIPEVGKIKPNQNPRLQLQEYLVHNIAFHN